MTVLIKETGKKAELTIVNRKTGLDWSNDLIGSSGAIGQYINYDAECDAYRTSQDDYDWWTNYIEMYTRYETALGSLIEQYGEDAVNDIILRPELTLSDDYDNHAQELQAQLDAIRDEL